MMKPLVIGVYLGAAWATFGADLTVTGGTASFVVNTTVPGISVKGKSTALQGRASVQRSADGLRLENAEATVPVKSILTGMAVRDEHMRNYIFTTADGKTPNLHFESAGAACAPKKGDFNCQVSGSLSVRGVAHSFSVTLKVKAENAGFHASGASVIRLSDYGIEQPSQFGVKTLNEIELHIEFTGQEAPTTTASGGKQ